MIVVQGVVSGVQTGGRCVGVLRVLVVYGVVNENLLLQMNLLL